MGHKRGGGLRHKQLMHALIVDLGDGTPALLPTVRKARPGGLGTGSYWAVAQPPNP